MYNTGTGSYKVFLFVQALEEESTMTPEQLALKNVGKQVRKTAQC